MSLSGKTDAEISQLLSEYGVKHGPIVDSTRRLYEKKLIAAMENKAKETPSDKTYYREEVEEVTYVSYPTQPKKRKQAPFYDCMSSSREPCLRRPRGFNCGQSLMASGATPTGATPTRAQGQRRRHAHTGTGPEVEATGTGPEVEATGTGPEVEATGTGPERATAGGPVERHLWTCARGATPTRAQVQRWCHAHTGTDSTRRLYEKQLIAAMENKAKETPSDKTYYREEGPEVAPRPHGHRSSASATPTRAQVQRWRPRPHGH
ncbi:hypothetical protein CRUP_038742, partial [Coryphaenoides rupestris]